MPMEEETPKANCQQILIEETPYEKGMSDRKSKLQLKEMKMEMYEESKEVTPGMIDSDMEGGDMRMPELPKKGKKRKKRN
jgi:hypothetical protein